MEVLLNSDLSRNRDFRPYIDQEEYHRNLDLYDPNGGLSHHAGNQGLYDRTQPPCMLWRDHAHQQITLRQRAPGFMVGRNGYNFYNRYCRYI